MGTVSKTFRLSVRSARALEELASARGGVSQTAVLHELIDREKDRLDLAREEEALDAEWEQAMQSPEYRAESKRLEAEFAGADGESARKIP